MPMLTETQSWLLLGALALALGAEVTITVRALIRITRERDQTWTERARADERIRRARLEWLERERRANAQRP